VSAQGSGKITAPMPGRILDIFVKPGQHVSVGETLLTLEAMKMEQRLAANSAGTIKVIHVTKDTQVLDGQLLVEIESGEKK
jgi:3-methylcrotonyl-CoA carboxylase alpha subunit